MAMAFVKSDPQLSLFLGEMVKIPLVLRPNVMLQVFILTLMMCGTAGAIAAPKLSSADLADIF